MGKPKRGGSPRIESANNKTLKRSEIPPAMAQIKLTDLEVFYCVGVTEQERSQAQRLLLTVAIEFDFHKAAGTDSIQDTIDYFNLAQDLLKFGSNRSWCLLEKLATDIAER